MTPQSYFQRVMLALVVNPNTGDRNATLIWIVVAALVVSAVVIAAMILSSRSTRKKKRK